MIIDGGGEIGERFWQFANGALGEIFDAGEEFSHEKIGIGDAILRRRTAIGSQIEMFSDVHSAVEMEALADKNDIVGIVKGDEVLHTGVGVDTVGVGCDGQRRNAVIEQVVAHG